MARRRLTPEEVTAVINAGLVKADGVRPAGPRRAGIRVKTLRARLRAKLMGRRGRTGGLVATTS